MLEWKQGRRRSQARLEKRIEESVEREKCEDDWREEVRTCVCGGGGVCQESV